MLIKNVLDEMSIDDEGNHLLKDKTYIEDVFECFEINPILRKVYSIVDTSFTDCKVINGEGMIMNGTVLKNVSFIDFNCGNILHISSEVIFDNVKIASVSYPKTLWIRPEREDYSDENNSSCGNLFLDIVDFRGEVSITGLPADKVKIDSDKQVVIRADLLRKIDWKKLGLNGLSYWKLMARKVDADHSFEGIFSMPPINSRDYERSVKELKILKELGHVD